MKDLAVLWLPNLGLLYFVLAIVLDLPAVTEVLVAILAIIALLQIIQKKNEYDGTIDIVEQALGGKIYSLNLKGDPEEIDKKDQVLFKVSKPPSEG